MAQLQAALPAQLRKDFSIDIGSNGGKQQSFDPQLRQILRNIPSHAAGTQAYRARVGIAGNQAAPGLTADIHIRAADHGHVLFHMAPPHGKVVLQLDRASPQCFQMAVPATSRQPSASAARCWISSQGTVIRAKTPKAAMLRLAWGRMTRATEKKM